MVRFSLDIKTCCLFVIWEKQDKIWAKFFCIPKNMHSRTPMCAVLVFAFARLAGHPIPRMFACK